MEKTSIKGAVIIFISLLIFFLSCTLSSTNSVFAASNNTSLNVKPQLVVNGKEVEMLKVGQNSQITVGVYLNEQPMTEQKVSLDGYGEWTTGNDGTFTANITPRNGQDIGIRVGGQYYYRGILFAAEDNQGVVEVRLKDSSNADLDNFYVWAKNGDMWKDIDGEGYVSRVLAREGQNSLVVARWDDGNNYSYYVEKDIDVTPGLVMNQVEVTPDDYMEADINLAYDGISLSNSGVTIGKNFDGYGWLNRDIGAADSIGVKRVFVSPGSHKVAASGIDFDGASLYLMDYKYIMDSTSGYSFDWYSSNTGLVTMDVTNPIPSEMRKSLVLNGSWISFDNPKGVRINSGTYNINIIGMDYNINGQWNWYHYKEASGQDEVLNVNPGMTVNKSYDLTPQPLTLNVYEDNMHNGKILFGNSVHFGVTAPTPSGYVLDDKEGNRDLDISILRPDGWKDYIRSFFKDMWYNVEGNNPTGLYTINVKANLNPLYEYSSLTAYFTADKPQVTIDGGDYKIIRTQESSQVTIKVALDGQPMAGQKVSLDGYGEWMTGDDGTVTADIFPGHGSDIGIHVADRYNYNGVLFAARNDQGVAEVNLTDKDGILLENFTVDARSQNMGSGVQGEGSSVRILTGEGQNTFTIARFRDGEEASYYINKDINIIAGLDINHIHITQDDYTETDLNFIYDGNPINNIRVVLGTNSALDGWICSDIGLTNSLGAKKAYVSPGISYSVATNGYFNNDSIYLIKQDQTIASGTNTFEWYQEQTGRVKINIASPLPDIRNKTIELDGYRIRMNDENGVIMSTGSYKLDSIWLDFVSENQDMWCDYKKPSGQEEILTVNPGSQDLFYDLTPEDLRLEIDNSQYIVQGDNVRFGVVASTPSGYQLYDMSNRHDMNVNIQMPDGQEYNFQSWFEQAYWGVGDGKPFGQYTINVTGNLEPLYQGSYNLTGTFEVSKPQILVNNKEVEILKAGENSSVTISATQNGQPLTGMDVNLDGFGHIGTTDANGSISTMIKPDWGQNIGIHIGQLYYKSLLFAVEDGQGVIEVRLKDKDGMELNNFYAEAKSQDMSWNIQSDDNIARVLAWSGENTLTVFRSGSGNEGSYYIQKSINVTPGLSISQVQITQTDYNETNIGFVYDSYPLSNAGLTVAQNSDNNGWISRYLGPTDYAGMKKVFMSPGTYRIAITGNDNENVPLYLVDNKDISLETGNYNWQWYKKDTGIASLNITNSVTYDMKKYLLLDGTWVNFDNSNGVRISSGSYNIDLIETYYWINGEWQWFNYSKPSGQEDTFNISSGGSLGLSYDLTLQPKLIIYDDNMFEGNLLPGNSVHFGVEALTSSGYQLEDNGQISNVDVTITRPDGLKNFMTGFYRDMWYYVDGNSPNGQYSINVKGILGSLYGDFDLTTNFTVYKLQVKVNGKDLEILSAGQDNQVTIELTLDGQPMAGQSVSLDGYGEWITGDDGKFTVAINSDFGREIVIRVGNNYTFTGVLFVVQSDQGVAEIRQLDKNGMELDNLFVEAKSGNMTANTFSNDSVARVLAMEGQNILIVTRSGNGDEDSYYTVKNVNIIPGLSLNQVLISQDDYTEADLSFMYDSDSISKTQVILSKTFDGYGSITTEIGTTNDIGTKKVFITPGTYKIAISGYDKNGSQLYLMDNLDILNGTSGYNFQWYQADTGKVTLDIINPAVSEMSKALILDGMWINFDNPDGVRINSGEYKLEMIGMRYILNGEWVWYNYAIPFGQEETLNITPGSLMNLSYDLTPLDITLRLYDARMFGGNVLPDSSIHFGVELTTPSGYQLQNIYTGDNANVTISRPDGQVDYMSGYFRDMWYYVGQNSPAGQYTINVRGTFGALYGDYDLTVKFMVGTPQIEVNGKPYEIVRVGENSDVTIMVTSNGQPVAGQDVTLDSFGYIGTTDVNGSVTTTINPGGGQDIGISIGQFYCKGLLFAVDGSQGVVEVRLKDPQDIDLDNFYAKVQGQKMWQDGTASGGSVRVLAAAGQNTMMLSRKNYDDGVSYYIVKDINVVAGVDVNTAQITKDDYVKAKMQFMYDSDPLKNTTVVLGKTGLDYTNNDVGAVDDFGLDKAYVSPGEYKVAVYGQDKDGNSIYLIKDNQVMDGSTSSYTFQWNMSDTCRVNLRITSPLTSITNRVLDLSGSWISFNDPNGVFINSGEYTLNKIHLDFNDVDYGMWCDYKMPDGQEEILNIVPGTMNLYYDLTPLSLSLGVYGKEYNGIGDKIRFQVVASTPSGYELLDMSDHHEANQTINMPDGQVSNWQPWFYTSAWMVTEGEPIGEYTVNMTGNFYPLYGDYDLTGSFTVGIPHVEVNGKPCEIIGVGESTEVTVYASVNGQPIAHKNISISGYASGMTDQYGKFSAVITPNRGEDINIYLEGQDGLSGVLFAVDDNQGVVEVSAVDRDGMPMKDFWVKVASSNMNNYTYTGQDGEVVRILVNKGDNLLLLNQHVNGLSYNIVKQINVNQGTDMNYIMVDGSDTVETDMSFSYEGQPIANADVMLENLDLSYYGYLHGYVGLTDNDGFIKVFMTPGPYLVTINKSESTSTLNGDNTMMYLKKDGINIQNNGVYSFNWNSSDVGKLKINIKSQLTSVQKRAIDLNGSLWIFIGDGTEMLVSSGTYRVGGIHLEDNTGGDWLGYDFRKPQDSMDKVTIESGKLFNYNIDLTLKAVDLKLESNLVQTGNPIKYGVEALSDSGYLLDWFSGNSTMHMTIIKPNGNVVDMVQDFRHGGYFIEKGEPEGIYKLHAYTDFGPVLGFYEFDKSFQVVDDSSVYVVSTYPPNGSTGVPVNAEIKANFSCNIQEGDQFDNVALMAGIGTNSSKVEAGISIVDNTLVIKPLGDLNYNTLYNVVIPAGAVRNEIGGRLIDDYGFEFTTKLPVDISYGHDVPAQPIADKLKVVNSLPSDGSAGVPIDQVITVFFNKKINLVMNVNDRIKSQGINLRDMSGVVVPVEYTAIDNKLVIKPKYSLNFDTEYLLTIPGNAICDQNNNNLGTSYSLKFFTESAAPDEAVPAASGGIPDASPISILSIDDINVTLIQGDAYCLQNTVTANLSDDSKKELCVTWDESTMDTSKIGKYTFVGNVEGYDRKVNLTLNVIMKQETRIKVY